jgi:16S rRNA (cytidine1402-2'-O)-methyltransferase
MSAQSEPMRHATIRTYNARMPIDKGKLYLVATPIGNLEDVTFRAIRLLKEVDLIACEDTRQTQKLLNHYGIHKRQVSYHEHNEHERAVELVAELEKGASIALVSDAGTPLLSDPGARLVRECVERGIPVIPIPGANSLLAALSASGIPCEQFLFAGFLPARQGERRRALAKLALENVTLVFFEAPHRIAAALRDAAEILGPRTAALARELTKIHEEFIRGSLRELSERFESHAVKGELTLVVGPPQVEDKSAISRERTIRERVEEIMKAEGLDRKAALKKAAREAGLPRREAYKKLLADS